MVTVPWGLLNISEGERVPRVREMSLLFPA
jgi:hypothetical protein